VKEGKTMTISEKIEKLKSKCKSEKYIDIFYTEAEYHPSNTGFYLSDLVNYPVEDFVPKELLEKQLVSDREYTKKGLSVIALGFN